MNPQEATNFKPNSTENNFEDTPCKGFTLCEAIAVSVHQGVVSNWGIPGRSPPDSVAGAPTTFNADRILNILQEVLVEIRQEDLFG